MAGVFVTSECGKGTATKWPLWALGLLSAALAAFLVAAPIAHADEKRLALVLSNQDYPAAIGSLSQTHADGDAVAGALGAIGFAVTRGRDQNARETRAAIAAFQNAINAEAADGDQVVAFIYASMHGVALEADGRIRNFLLPAKEELAGTFDVLDRGVRLDLLVQSLAATDAKAVVLISDACRNTLRSSFSKGNEKGFVQERAGPGMLIAYATEAGSTTPDDGLFASILASELRKQGRKAGYAMLDTLASVGRRRSWDGQPFMTGGLPDWFCFNGCTAPAAATLPDATRFAAPAAAPSSTAVGAYDLRPLNLSVRNAVEMARENAAKGEAAAARAREAAAKAYDAAARARRKEKGYESWDNEAGTGRYEGGSAGSFLDLFGSSAQGYGVFTTTTGDYSGNIYAGQYEKGDHTGSGVQTYGDNPKNTGNWLRYEGDWVEDRRDGFGVYVWKDGGRFAGSWSGSVPNGPATRTYPGGGWLYEGEQKNSLPDGFGAVWDSQGKLSEQGIYKEGTLVTSLAR